MHNVISKRLGYVAMIMVIAAMVLPAPKHATNIAAASSLSQQPSLRILNSIYIVSADERWAVGGSNANLDNAGLLKQAAANMRAARSYHLEVSGSIGGADLSLSGDFDIANNNSDLTISVAGQNIEVISLGSNTYLSSDGGQTFTDAGSAGASITSGMSQFTSMWSSFSDADVDRAAAALKDGSPSVDNIDGTDCKHMTANAQDLSGLNATGSSANGTVDLWVASDGSRVCQIKVATSDSTTDLTIKWSNLNSTFNITAPTNGNTPLQPPTPTQEQGGGMQQGHMTIGPPDTPTPAPPPTDTPTNTPVPTNTPQPTATPPAGVQLVIAKVEFDPNPPIEFKPVNIKVIVENRGTQKLPFNWPYKGSWSLDTIDAASQKPLVQSDDFVSSPDAMLEFPGAVPQRWQITVPTRFWNGNDNSAGRLSIIVQPEGGLAAMTLSTVVNIKNDGDPLTRCSTFVLKNLSRILSLLPHTQVVRLIIKAVTTTFEINACKNAACVASAIGKAAFSLIPGADIILLVRDLLNQKQLYQDVGDCINSKDLAIELVKEAWRQGKAIFFQAIHSPASILVTNAAGQRAGILDDGSIVREIPGSEVVVVGEEKYVLYPPTSATTTRLHGTGNGTMTIEMIGGANGNASDVIYRNVPVNPNLMAQISGDTSDPNLQIDSKGTGQFDQSRPPDQVEVLTANGVAATATSTSSEAAPDWLLPAIMGVAILLIIVLILLTLLFVRKQSARRY